MCPFWVNQIKYIKIIHLGGNSGKCNHILLKCKWEQSFIINAEFILQIEYIKWINLVQAIIVQAILVIVIARNNDQVQEVEGWGSSVSYWQHFSLYWPFVRGIHRSPVNSPYKGQWRWALMFSFIRAWINDWVNNREAGDLGCYRCHYGVIVMLGNFIIWIPRILVTILLQIISKFSLR